MSLPTDLTSFLAEPKDGPSNEIMSRAKITQRNVNLMKAEEKLVFSCLATRLSLNRYML